MEEETGRFALLLFYLQNNIFEIFGISTSRLIVLLAALVVVASIILQAMVLQEQTTSCSVW